MISCSGLLGDITSYGDRLRYRRDVPRAQRKPIVVWTCTRRCNLSCLHCYADSENTSYAGELSHEEAKQFIDDLKAFDAPVLLFSGGEPLMRKDLFELNTYARSKGLRTVISTNGTLITPEMARKIKDSGFEYIGISLDGMGEMNDKFRGKAGAFNDALSGIRNLVEVGQKVGLRFTITKYNYRDIPRLFELVEKEGVNRICFYHLAYAGRGAGIEREDLPHAETRKVIESIYDWTVSLAQRGIPKEVLTVDNHADGALLYLKLKKTDPARAEAAYKLMRANGGNASGISIANVDNLGNVHPDQFWNSVTFGNVRERKFGDIWTDTTHSLMGKLKERASYLKGRCTRCKFMDICNGNLRLRAEVGNNDVWGDDPACYLTDDEITNTQTPSL